MLRPIIERKCSHDKHWIWIDAKMYRCTACGTFGFTKHKPGRLRPSKMYEFVCSAKRCRRPAKRKMKGLRAGGLRTFCCGRSECAHELTPKAPQGATTQQVA